MDRPPGHVPRTLTLAGYVRAPRATEEKEAKDRGLLKAGAPDGGEGGEALSTVSPRDVPEASLHTEATIYWSNYYN